MRRTVTLGELLPLSFGPHNLHGHDRWRSTQCVDAIRARAPGFTPRVGVVLGSGLGGFADEVEAVATLPYAELPGFPAARRRAAMPASWCSATSAGRRSRVLQGRAHYYEHGRADEMKVADARAGARSAARRCS